jgi:hypothetical protein
MGSFAISKPWENFFVRQGMRLLTLHLQFVANITNVGRYRALTLRPNQSLDSTVRHMRLMDEPCVLPDVLQRPVTNRQGCEHETEGNMQNSLCIEELKLKRYSLWQLPP